VSRLSKYREQFRKDAVALVRASDRPLRQVARELGVNHETLRNWVKTHRTRPGDTVGPNGRRLVLSGSMAVGAVWEQSDAPNGAELIPTSCYSTTMACSVSVFAGQRT
jgi:transposase-like protein